MSLVSPLSAGSACSPQRPRPTSMLPTPASLPSSLTVMGSSPFLPFLRSGQWTALSPSFSTVPSSLHGRGSVFVLQHVDAAIYPPREWTQLEWWEVSRCWAVIMCIIIYVYAIVCCLLNKLKKNTKYNQRKRNKQSGDCSDVPRSIQGLQLPTI